MNWADVLKAVIPVIVASLAWLLGQVSDFSVRLTKIEGRSEEHTSELPVTLESRMPSSA